MTSLSYYALGRMRKKNRKIVVLNGGRKMKHKDCIHFNKETSECELWGTPVTPEGKACEYFKEAKE